jgi:single-strand DNA-binding protein
MNKTILFGNVGNDPIIKTFEGGNKNAKFSLATSSRHKDKEGETITDTQWHNIVIWGKLAELCEKYVKKGSSLIIEGEIRYRSYEDKNGETKYITEIVGNALHFAGKKEKPENETTVNNEVPKQDDPPY